ncbi:MAG: pilus assembly protein PilM [Pseudomonadota bacterium]
MPQRILGLDIGSYSIKAASFTTTFKFFELTDLYESPPLQMDDLEPAERKVVVKEALARLLHDNHLEPTAVITALSGVNVSTRILTLPLPDRQVERVLPFELESHIPFELDEIIIDHHTISTSKARTTCLAAAVKKSVLAEHLELLKGADLDPAYVGLDSLALYNLHLLTLREEGGTYAIVDIGHQKTSVCIVSGFQPRSVRTLYMGGRDITEAIHTGLDLTWEQAAEVKHNHGILELENHPLQSKDLRRLSSVIRQAVDPIVREVMQTLQAFRAQGGDAGSPGQPVEKIFLCGGTSLIRNLPEYLGGLTSLPVAHIQIFGRHDEAERKLGARQPSFAQAVGLGMRLAARGSAAKRTASLNFRKGTFTFAKDLSGIKEKAVFFGKWVAVIFVLALFHLGFRYQSLARQNSLIERSILRIYSEIVPNEPSKPKNAAAALKALETRIGKYEQQQAILTAGLNDLTALGILREVSQRIPPEIPLDTQELSIDRNKITLRGNTDSYASVDRIIAALKENPKFHKVEKGDIRESAEGTKAFMLTVTVGEEVDASKTRRKG